MRFFVNYMHLVKFAIYSFTFRYSLASRAFPVAKYSVVWTEFLMDSKFNFYRQKIIFPNSFSLIYTKKFKEIECFVHYIKFEMWSDLFYVNFFYFQRWNSNWGIALFNSTLGSKLRFLNVGLRLYFKLFPTR